MSTTPLVIKSKVLFHQNLSVCFHVACIVSANLNEQILTHFVNDFCHFRSYPITHFLVSKCINVPFKYFAFWTHRHEIYERVVFTSDHPLEQMVALYVMRHWPFFPTWSLTLLASSPNNLVRKILYPGGVYDNKANDVIRTASINSEPHHIVNPTLRIKAMRPYLVQSGSPLCPKSVFSC